MMPKGFGGMLKQAQKLQADLARLQEELGNRTVEGTAGGGMVKARATGKQGDTLYRDRERGGRP